MVGPSTIEDYLASLPDDRRDRIETIRRAVAAAAPLATESIAYQMPAFRSHGGRFLVSFAAWKRHDSLFPASEAVVAALGDELIPYLAGKGTIRFAADRPVPIDTIARIVAVRVAENAAHEAAEGDR